jgi:(S)-2-hydroxy-acid oxidase
VSAAIEVRPHPVVDDPSLRDNEDAYNKFKIRQRILVDVADVNTITSIFGAKVSLPLAFSPSAMHGLAHPDAEKGTSRAAAAKNIPMGLSTYSTTSLEDVIKERGNNTNPYVFQLSIPKDRSVPLGLIKRAEGISTASSAS